MANSVTQLIEICADNLKGRQQGICSVCSSNPIVIDASLAQCLEDGSPLLIESTSNQVDQFGGYSGMKPCDFLDYISIKARRQGYDPAKVIFGGDHLGPNRWQNQNADEAMDLACTVVSEYVKAGYRKIHLDASMPLGGDGGKVSEVTVAARAARLCKVAEDSFKSLGPNDCLPVYIIGTEVPVPGGVTEIEELHPTSKAEALKTIETTKEAFENAGIGSVWERVLGMVVQPGVEFGNNYVSELNPTLLGELSDLAEKYGTFVYEAHSTDYQPFSALQELVNNHFAILKVGPWLSWAAREGLYSLENIERLGIVASKCSNLYSVSESVMLENPSNWIRHCHGNDTELRLERHFGLSDRIRYYLGQPEVQEAEKTLMNNMKGYSEAVSLGLVSQFMPTMYEKVRLGKLRLGEPEKLVQEYVRDVLRIYHQASGYPCR